MSNKDFFLGRKNQVKSFTNFLNSNKNNAALVYGRRRVGKTELLKHCLNQSLSTSIYYELNTNGSKGFIPWYRDSKNN